MSNYPVAQRLLDAALRTLCRLSDGGEKVQLDSIRVAELFAGVGGFRLALDGYESEDNPSWNRPPAGPFHTVWANQWEPPGTDARQFAWKCYESRFGSGSCVNRDIAEVLDEAYEGILDIPDVDMLVGGFPCQDYSVAKPLSLSEGIAGKKGVLWWEILRFLQLKKPRFILLENVDRLLKSPTGQRGRDFAVILSCLAREGYSAEWRVINAADYGMPQRRRRVFIFGVRDEGCWNLPERTCESGIFASAFPGKLKAGETQLLEVPLDPYEASNSFGSGKKRSPFKNAGAMQGGTVATADLVSTYSGPRMVLSDVVIPDSEVPEVFFIPDEKIPAWEYQRSAKKIKRTTRGGFSYDYAEGAMPWPDPTDRPSRTILTGEGGSGASRMKHAIRGDSERIRRLVPDELDQLQMFPKGWTRGMSDGHRAFCMGNALVVGIPHEIGKAICRQYLGRGE